MKVRIITLTLSLLFQSSLLVASEPVPTQHLPELGIDAPVEAETCTSTESTETTGVYDWVTGMGQKALSALAPPTKCRDGWCIVCLKGNECGPLGFCSSQPAHDGSQSNCKVGIPRALCEQLGYQPIVTPGKDRKCTKTGVPTEDLEKFLKDYPSHVPSEKNWDSDYISAVCIGVEEFKHASDRVRLPDERRCLREKAGDEEAIKCYDHFIRTQCSPMPTHLPKLQFCLDLYRLYRAKKYSHQMQECTCKFHSEPPTRLQHCTNCRDACMKECEASNDRLRKSQYPFMTDDGRSGRVTPACQDCNQFCTAIGNGYCIGEERNP